MKILNLSFFLILLVIGCTEPTNQDNFVKFNYDGHILVNAVLNDSLTGLFILDTGADGLYLDSNFVESNKNLILSADTASMRGAGNNGLISVVIITNSIKTSIGNISQDFDTIPILKLRQIVNADVAGIIGCNILKKGILAINNSNSTLSLDTTINVKNYKAFIPFNFVNGRIFINPKIELAKNQFVSPNLMIDLGCSDAIIFNTKYYKTIVPFISKHIDFSIADAGVSGDSEGGEFRIASFSLGNLIKDSLVVSFSKDTLGAHASDEYDGLLGNDILNRFNYLIDFRSKRLYLSPNEKFSTPFESTKFGIYAVKEGNFAFVKCIYHQFDGFQKGLRLGDSIIQINNKSISELTQTEIDSILENENHNIILKFKTNHGIQKIDIKPKNEI